MFIINHTHHEGSPSNYGRYYDILTKYFKQYGTSGHAVGWCTALQTRRSRVWFPIV